VLVSIVINNFNYARFLRDAIDSALQQDYPNLEVIVVDDGSTDNSAQVIASYGTRVIPVYKENGGQGSTFNAGFAKSKGDVICFLDADDVFLPEKCSAVAHAYEQNPSASLIYHRLQHVDMNKNKTGKPWPRSVLHGDIRSKVERTGTWWPCPTTTALCPSRAFLSKILPLPADAYRLCADGYIAGLAPFFGPVIGLDQTLAMYRMHGGNLWNFRGLTPQQESRRRLEQFETEFTRVMAALNGRSAATKPISLDDHFPYQFHLFMAGLSRSRSKLLMTLLGTRTLPFPMKWREGARLTMRFAKNAWQGGESRKATQN
jgi:glycosyltransferase involved in cell wall biosynthesis